MTALENAASRSAERAASAVSPDTVMYGDQPTTSSVNRVPRSTEAPPTSASSAFNSTSLRDSLIAALRSCRKRSVQRLLAIRYAFRTRGPSPWLPRIRHLSARPRRATERGVRSHLPGPPEAAHIAPAPGSRRRAPDRRQAPDRRPPAGPRISCFRGELSPPRQPPRQGAPGALSVA